jgi:hypothetical protein
MVSVVRARDAFVCILTIINSCVSENINPWSMLEGQYGFTS